MLVSRWKFGQISIMQAAVKSDFVTVADYLAAEEVSQIGSLEEYVLVGQAEREVTVFRRVNEWKAEKFSGARARVALSSLKVTLPLAAIYEGL